VRIVSETPEGLRSPPRRIFACGADLKGCCGLLSNGRLRMSGGHGDLAETDNLARFLAAARAMREEAGVEPELVAHDLHPDYFSRAAAALFPATPRLAVQHHCAHVAAVLARHSCAEEVIGVVFDGAGRGTDGAVWGGEFLAVSPRGWERCGHLAYLGMPGGDAAAREPWRMGLSLLHATMGEAAFDAPVPFRERSAAARRPLGAMLARGVLSPRTSSCGRLFDAVAAILGIAPATQREAEAAIELERRASLSDDREAYPFPLRAEGNGFEARCEDFAAALMADLRRGVPAEAAARRFHNGLAALILRAAEEIRRARGCRAVVLCGGVFQNRLLAEGASRMLREAGFETFESPGAPLNDLGICVGQLWVALRGGRRNEPGGGSDRCAWRCRD
jgi:hydrogenase maturation protein HypF